MKPCKLKSLVLVAVFISACHQPGHETSATPQPPPTDSQPSEARESTPRPAKPDEWKGRWNGPEGTYVSISGHGNDYVLEIADLDGPKSYAAKRAGDHLVFERNGLTESIRATDGKQTGMKWLQDRTTCLTIRSGEGFCRD